MYLAQSQLDDPNWYPKYKRDYQLNVLARCETHVTNAPYKVSVRWLLYRLLEDGTLTGDKKKEERNLDTLLIKARYSRRFPFWNPDTLADETRTPILCSVISDKPIRNSVAHWKANVKENGVNCPLDPYVYQPEYFAVCYEARAMTGQFQYLIPGVDLFPCGGQTSLTYRYEMAQTISDAALHYANLREQDTAKATVLYFGDNDEYGYKIYDTVEHYLGEWKLPQVKLDVQRIGLNSGPIKQWEGLSDDQAKALLVQGLTSVNYDFDGNVKRAADEQEAEAELKEFLKDW